jgi:NitT/TauT family transport system ATP-binding protein
VESVVTTRAVSDPSAAADILVDGVSHAYATTDAEVRAIDDVSFAIPPGRFIGLVGPSGCGKSTLLLMMAGLLRATRGRVIVRGEEIARPEPTKIGVVFQEASLLPWKTAAENIEFPLKLRGAPPAERRARARELLELVGLAEFGGRLPHELSGGMKQRVAIARGLCQDPQILLMDEPFAALDEQTRMTMGAELLRIWDRQQKTVVFVTHSLTEAVYLCDEVLVMSHRPGRILERVVITLPRPRNYDMMATETFGRLRDRIWRMIRRD